MTGESYYYDGEESLHGAQGDDYYVEHACCLGTVL